MAAFLEGKCAQAFPSFGSERMGAPVASYCRIDDRPIRSREPVVQPDIVVVQDATLLHDRNPFEGLKWDGHILLNSGQQFEELADRRACNVPATEIALRHLGRALPNSALLGGLAALTGAVGLDSMIAAIKGKFAGDIGERNAAAAAEAFQFVSQKTGRIAGDVRC